MFKKQVADKSRKMLSEELKIKISKEFSATYKKYYFKYPDKRDYYLINTLITMDSIMRDICPCVFYATKQMAELTQQMIAKPLQI